MPKQVRDQTFSFSDLMSVVELAGRRETPIGAFLASLPDWLLRAADTWAKQEASYRAKHRLPNRERDPWQFLLDAPALPQSSKRVLRAAQSWLSGFRVLCRLATGTATLNTDWLEMAEKAKASGDRKKCLRAIGKIADKLSLSRVFQADVRRHADGTKTVQQMEWYAEQRWAKLVHRDQNDRWKAVFNPRFRLIEIEPLFPLEFFLVESWLRFPNGPWPGLMFWSNKAITKWFFAQKGLDPKLSYKNLGRDYVKKTRQRLGLISVSDKTPWVWDVEVESMSNGNLKIKGWSRQGDKVFDGERAKPDSAR